LIEIIIEIGIKLFELSEYLNYHQIVHRDIKPNNIVWDILENSNILNKIDFYFIGYGYSEFMGLTFSRK